MKDLMTKLYESLQEADEQSMVTDVEDGVKAAEDAADGEEGSKEAGGEGATEDVAAEVKEALIGSIKDFLGTLNEIGLPIKENEDIAGSLFEHLDNIVELAKLEGFLEGKEYSEKKDFAKRILTGAGIGAASGYIGGKIARDSQLSDFLRVNRKNWVKGPRRGVALAKGMIPIAGAVAGTVVANQYHDLKHRDIVDRRKKLKAEYLRLAADLHEETDSKKKAAIKKKMTEVRIGINKTMPVLTRSYDSKNKKK